LRLLWYRRSKVFPHGKTTLAQKIAQRLGGATIIHTDDYYKPSDQRTSGLVDQIVSPDFDWDLMEREVFISPQPAWPVGRPPLTDNRGSNGEIVIVVGVYALQKRFRKYYDFTIWVDASRDVRIKRMIEREGEAVAKEWQEKWLPREERYLGVERPDKRASVCLTV
jgi:uridine kinase